MGNVAPKLSLESVRERGLNEAEVVERYAAFGLSSVTKLQRYRSRGIGPRYRKVGRVVTYDRADVEAWLEQCKVAPGEGY